MAGEDRLIPVQVFSLSPGPEGAPPGTVLVLLKGQEDPVVPLVIGLFEGQVLAMALQRIPLPRPLPHHLLQNLLEKLHSKVHQLVIHTLKGEVFHAALRIKTPAEAFALDCRPSDGLILATLMGAPIYLSAAVMEKASQELDRPSEDIARNEAAPAAAPSGRGRAPAAAEREAAGAPATERERSALDVLYAQLDRLVAEEAYEAAAQLRDQIRERVRHLEARKPDQQP